jgi:hypothetical protein
LIRLADVVVLHGGPASIMEVRGLGKLPVVVPRDPRYGEHVDGHQLRFARRMSAAGLVKLCEAQQELTEALKLVRSDPSAYVLGTSDGSAFGGARGAGAAEVARIIHGLVTDSTRPRLERWTARVLRRGQRPPRATR